MSRSRLRVESPWKPAAGPGVVEYALLAAFVAVACVAVLRGLAPHLARLAG